MAVCDLSRKGLIFSDLDQKLRELDESVVEINLSWNEEIKEQPDFRRFKNLKSVNLLWCGITEIRPELFPLSVESIDLSRNNITSQPDLTSFNHLKSVNLSLCGITEIQPEFFPLSVESIDLSQNKIKSQPDLIRLNHLKSVNLSWCGITEIRSELFPLSVESIDLSHGKITSQPDLSRLNHLRSVNLSWCGITEIRPEFFALSVESIDLYGNKIPAMINLRSHSNIQSLNLSSNSIQEINWELFPVGIESIHLSDNPFKEFEFFRLCQLSKLKLLSMSVSHTESREQCLAITKIESVQFPQDIEEICLGEVRIKQIGNLTGLTQLKKLTLRNCGLETVREEHLPEGIEVIDLSDNNISEVPKLRALNKLKSVSLGRKIVKIEWGNFPQQIEHVNLGSNKIKEIGGDVIQLKKLKRIDLTENQIPEVDSESLPPALEVLNLGDNTITEIPDVQVPKTMRRLNLWNNKIAHIPEMTTDMMRICLICRNRLTHIDKAFFKSEQHWEFITTDHDTYKLIQPPQEVLMRGLEAVHEYFSHRLVSYCRHRVILLGPKLAGKSSLLASLVANKPKLVHRRNRTHMVNVKTLELTEEDFLEIYDHGGHPVYGIVSHFLICRKCTVLMVHDVTKPDDIDDTIKLVRQVLHKHPDVKIHSVLTHTDCLEPESLSRNARRIQLKLQAVLREEIENAERKINRQRERETLGSKAQYPEKLKHVKENMKHFEVSSQNFEGITALKEFLTEVARQEKVDIPDHWEQLFVLMKKEEKFFLYLQDVREIVEKESTFPENFAFHAALNYFHDAGISLHYGSNKDLNKYVFHKVDFVVDIFKCVFHHAIEQIFNFDTNRDLQRLFKRQELEMALNQYQHEGLLSMKLIRYFWQHYNLSKADSSALIKLMEAFDICHPVTPDENILYFPWFVDRKRCPESIKTEDIYMTTDNFVAQEFTIEFFNQIPMNFFEMLCVRLQRLAIEKNYVGERIAWSDGIILEVGTTRCLIERDEGSSTIKVCVQGEVDNLFEVWQVLDHMLSASESILDEWDGVIKDDYIICLHCKMFDKTPKKRRLRSDVFPKNMGTYSSIKCCGDIVPRVLVVSNTSCSGHPSLSKEDIDRAKTYLEQNCKGTKPPKLQQVDCLQLSEEEFQLSWTYPSTGVTGVVIEAKDETGQWNCLSSTVESTSYPFHGRATEFRIATKVNSAIGDFFCIKPTPILSDEKLSEDDHQSMQHFLENFCLLTNLKGVATRLTSRGALQNDALEKITRTERNEGSSRAAGLLMESVLRMTYQQLFFFKKVLKETGQDILAKAVIVRLKDGTKLDMHNV